MKNRFLKPISFFWVATLVFAACSPQVYVQKDDSVNLSTYKTFAWVETRETHEQKDHNDLQEMKIRKAVNEELVKTGWQEDTANPDALLAYDLLIQKTIKQTSDPVYSRPFSRFYYNPYTRRWSSLYYPSQFIGYSNSKYQVNEGTLTISLIDQKTDKVVWQGWTTDDVNTKLLTDKEIKAGVRNIFRKFNVVKNN